jgi:16S rRNA (guanine966-N2)-methyltransferase
MRVIAGSLKGRRLKTPSWEGLRPTSDKLRETLFNILAPRIAGARVLDGYAGTGALGIEALSRGAAWVTLIEDDRRAQLLIAENLARCGIENSYAIIRAKVARALDSLHNQPAFEPFEIVLLDPPYARRPVPRDWVPGCGVAGFGGDDLEAILTAAGRVLAPAGVLVLERARRDRAPEAAGRLRHSRTVVSGDSALSFYEMQSGSHGS